MTGTIILRDDETVLSRMHDAPAKKRYDISTLKLLSRRRGGSVVSAFSVLAIVFALLVICGMALGITAAVDPSLFSSSASEHNSTAP